MDSKTVLRRPQKDDAKKIVKLIKIGGTLDLNSEYLYLLQCTHFNETCCVAVENDEIVGFVSGYCVPNSFHTLFIWQVAVHSKNRGQNLAARMIGYLIDKTKARVMLSTVSPSNTASKRVFEKVAQAYNATLTQDVLFEKDDFLAAHEEEVQFCIESLQQN